MSPHQLYDSPKYTPSFTLQDIFAFWSSSFCYEQPISIIHFLRNKKYCYPPQDIFFRWLFQRAICIVYLQYFLYGYQTYINCHHQFHVPPHRYNQSYHISYHFLFMFIQHIISHSINHLLIWHLSIRCICTLWIGLYQNNNIIFIRSIYK